MTSSLPFFRMCACADCQFVDELMKRRLTIEFPKADSAELQNIAEKHFRVVHMPGGPVLEIVTVDGQRVKAQIPLADRERVERAIRWVAVDANGQADEKTRRRAKHLPRVAHHREDRQEEPHLTVQRSEDLAALRAAMLELTAEQRLVVWLHLSENVPLREISRRCNISIKRVRNSERDALSHLRRRLAPREAARASAA